jgi:hypothetical protein
MNKKLLLGLGICALAIALIFVLMNRQGAQALNVNDVGSDPAAFTGTITITGVTKAVSPQDPTLFGIIDIKELSCTMVNCNKLMIPISYTGPIPAIGDEVRITGNFVNKGNGFLFAATAVKVVRHHQIGG